jgi:hypothetical protein
MAVKVPPKGTRGIPFPAFLPRLGNRYGARIETDAPAYAAYRSKTDREIPVLRLTKR